MRNYLIKKKIYGILCFFHALEMSFTSLYGKLLLKNGFRVEHENVYYKKMLENEIVVASDRVLKHDPISKGYTKIIIFFLKDYTIEKWNIFYPTDEKRVYLRWTFLLVDFQIEATEAKVWIYFVTIFIKNVETFILTLTIVFNIIITKMILLN